MSVEHHHDAATQEFHAPESFEQGYISDQQMNMASPYHFLGTHDDRSLLGSYNYHVHQVEAGKSIGPRLLVVLEYFRELYVRKRELFKKIFPGMFHDEFAEFFGKINGVLSQVKTQEREVQTMRRSLSLGSRRTRGIGGGEPPLRPDRFKIRTVIVDEVGQGSGNGSGGGQGGQSDTKSSGS